MSNPDLLPCPFCGESSAKFAEIRSAGRPYFLVRCEECEAQSFGCYCVDKVSAAIEWNRRAPHTAADQS